MAMGGRSAFAAATLLAAAVGGGLAGTVVNQSHDALAGARPARALAAGTPVAAGTRTAPPAARSGVISAVVLSYAGVTGTSARTASGGHGRVGTVRLGSTGTVLEPTHASRTAVPIAPGPATHSASGTPSAGAPPTGVTGAVGVTTAPDVPGPAGVAAGAAGDAGSGTGPASGITPGTDPFGDPGTPVTQPTLRSTVPVTVGGPTGTVSQLPTGLAGAGNATNGTSAPGTASAGLSTSSTIQSSVAATNQAGAGLKPASNATAGGLSAASTATSGLNGRSVVR